MQKNTTKGIAIVTGGSRGIGRAIAIQLAQDGYDIGLCYRSDEKKALEVMEEIKSLSRTAVIYKCDVSSYEKVVEFVEYVESELGPISLLVNNAGVTMDNPLVMMSPEDWQKVVDTNMGGVFNLCRTVVFGFMKNKAGNIINVSSVSGVHGNATQTNYSASKAGINCFSKALSKEVGSRNIRVNAVAPGFIETDMTQKLTDEQKVNIEERCSLRRLGQVEDVSNLVSFLASEKSSYITGQVFMVDGGLVL